MVSPEIIEEKNNESPSKDHSSKQKIGGDTYASAGGACLPAPRNPSAALIVQHIFVVPDLVVIDQDLPRVDDIPTLAPVGMDAEEMRSRSRPEQAEHT